ncbi:MAG: glycosyltransferase family 4 protein [Acidimicrobiales bacterium]
MTRVAFVSEIPVSYRHGWFEYLREHSDLDVNVIYLASRQTDRPWEQTHTDTDWCQVVSSRSLPGTDSGFFARISPTIGRTLLATEPDLVLLPGWAHPASWHAATWCRRNRIPYGVMFENWKAQSRTSMPARVSERIRSMVLDHAAVALPAGTRAAEYAATITDVPIHVLHANVADVDEARKASAGIDERDRRVVFLGRLMDHKGIDVVLDMAATLDAYGIGVDVVGDGPRRPDVERAAAEGSLSYHGTLVGEEKFALLARSHAALVPSVEEPWGVVVQEALASGTPVLASTEVGSTPEFIDAGVTGAVLPPERGAFEATVRSWADNLEPDRDACVARAESVNHATVSDELANAVEAVLA